MAKMPPTLGSVEFIDLPSKDPRHAGVRAGIRHVGPRQAKTWARRLQLLEEADERRLQTIRDAAIERHGSQEKALEREPRIFQEEGTDEGEAEFVAFFDAVFEAAIEGLDGIEGQAKDDQAAALRYLEYLSAADQIRLFWAILRQQDLTPRQSFPPADPGNPEQQRSHPPHAPDDPARADGGGAS